MLVDLLKLLGIGVIAGLLGYQVILKTDYPQVRPIGDVSSVAPENSNTRPNSLQQDLQRIVEKPLRDNFKFPESVKIKYPKIESSKLYQQVGLVVAPGEEIEVWKFCGVYSAPTPMGLYGSYEPFIALVSINHEEKEIAGEIWFKTDSDWRHIWSLRDRASTTSSAADYKQAGGENCDSASASIEKGEYAGFELGLVGMSKIYEEHAKRIGSDQKAKAFYEKCLAEKNSMGNCDTYSQCVLSPDREKNCPKLHQICAPNIPVSECIVKGTSKNRPAGDLLAMLSGV